MKKKGFILGTLALATLVSLVGPARAADSDKTYVMKMGTATINDAQQHWMEWFAAQVAKDSGGRIKSEIYHEQPARPDPARDRRNAVRRDPGLYRPARIPGRRRRAL